MPISRSSAKKMPEVEKIQGTYDDVDKPCILNRLGHRLEGGFRAPKNLHRASRLSAGDEDRVVLEERVVVGAGDEAELGEFDVSTGLGDPGFGERCARCIGGSEHLKTWEIKRGQSEIPWPMLRMWTKSKWSCEVQHCFARTKLENSRACR